MLYEWSKGTNQQTKIIPLYTLLVTLLLPYSQLFLYKVQHKVYNSPRKSLLNCTLPYKRCILERNAISLWFYSPTLEFIPPLYLRSSNLPSLTIPIVEQWFKKQDCTVVWHSLVLLRLNLAEVFKRKTTMLPEGFCIKPTVNTVTTFLVVY